MANKAVLRKRNEPLDGESFENYKAWNYLNVEHWHVKHHRYLISNSTSTTYNAFWLSMRLTTLQQPPYKTRNTGQGKSIFSLSSPNAVIF